MDAEPTSAAVQHYLDELAADSPAEAVVRALLGRAVHRLQKLCATLLYRSYPRLTRPPANLQPDELLGAVVERLLKALREARPASARQFFALACQHIRWELNDMARRLDEQPAAEELREELVPAPVSSDSGLTPNGRRILTAIDQLPEGSRETWTRPSTDASCARAAPRRRRSSCTSRSPSDSTSPSRSPTAQQAWAS